ncbi:hypothetical protein GRZ55_11075 [Chelativorans sp. ZYF759]|uniref:hypothetical protein n=1 Tax=Chelativorans sp. ZYF759 TaxID=2692213 RepID=UPI00145E0FAD|nr:hypothetical protein [Chelativorans sp. ZYF759]NMG39785.1 hypothetical protein [Chelativorans sp. ZYF759]
MNLGAEIWIAALYGGVLLLAAVGRYLSTRPGANSQAHITAMGLALDRDQMERGLSYLSRIAKALEAMSDKRQADMQGTLEEIVEHLKQPQSTRARKKPGE